MIVTLSTGNTLDPGAGVGNVSCRLAVEQVVSGSTTPLIQADYISMTLAGACNTHAVPRTHLGYPTTSHRLFELSI